MFFESGVVSEDWTSTVIIPLYKGKGERAECSNYEVLVCQTWLKKYIQES